jgi:putative spermidine/putrescine transport system permease protein
VRELNQQTKKGDILLLLPSLIPLLLIFLYPFLKGVLLTFQENGETAITLHNYIRFFTEKNFYLTIPRTIALVLPASLVEMVISFAMAYYLRKQRRGKSFINGLIVFPLTLGPLIIAVGMIDFFRPGGWFNEALIGMGILKHSAHLLYNYWGTFISLIFLGVAFMFSNLVGLMETIDPNLEKAAGSLGAGGWKTFTKVFFPLIRSGVLTVFSLNVIMQLAVYSSAIVVGNPASDSRVFSVVAFEEAMRNFDYNMATTIAMIMAFTQFISLGIIAFIRKRGFVGNASTFK